MKKYFLLIILVFTLTNVFCQNYISRTAHVNVLSANNVQTIEADNFQVACQLNTQSGQLKIIALIKSFEYKIGALNSVMNSRDIDVTQFPKITYDGNITDINKINFSKSGSYKVKLKGMFYIWDEKSPSEIYAIVVVNPNGTIDLKTEFSIPIEQLDSKKIEKIIKEKLPASLNFKPGFIGISKSIKVKANATLSKQ